MQIFLEIFAFDTQPETIHYRLYRSSLNIRIPDRK